MHLLIILITCLFISSYGADLKWEKVYNNKQNEIFFSNDCLDCLDSNNCIVVGSKSGYPLIYKTSDGGNSWVKIFDEHDEYFNKNDTLTPVISHVYEPIWFDKDTLLLARDYGMILKTTDMCQTFDTTKLKYGKSVKLKNIHMSDSKNGFTGSNRFLWTTNDGWDTWTEVNNPDAFFLQIMTSLWMHNKDFYGYSWIDKRIPAFYYSLTTDNGSSWHTTNISELTNKNIDLRDICFINDSLGFIAGGVQIDTTEKFNDLIVKTTNGGFSWEINHINNDKEWTGQLKSIEFLDKYNGIAAGEAGKILRTTDGGISWEREYLFNESDTIGKDNFAISVNYVGNILFLAAHDQGIWKAINYTGINDNTYQIKNIVLTYPNPCGSYIYYEFPPALHSRKAVLKVYDAAGNLVGTENLTIQPGRLKYIHEITTTGTYFWQIEAGGEVFNGKFVRE